MANPISGGPGDETEVYRSLLLEGLGFRPSYRGGLSNHLPMGLAALRRMGASGAELAWFYRSQLAHLERFPAPGAGAPEPVLGYYGSYLARIQASGRGAVLRESLPDLLGGMGGAAFHGMIRVAYAAESGEDRELAMALAYLADSGRTFALPPGGTPRTPEEIVAGLGPWVEGLRFPAGTISDRMSHVAGSLAGRGGGLIPESLGLPGLARFCARLYWVTTDFTILHTVTACHAYRLLAAFLPGPRDHLETLWTGVLLAILSTGKAAPAEGSAPDAPGPEGWAPVLRAVRRNLDEHAIKITYTCWREWGKYGDPLYFAIAARTAGPD